MAISIIDATAQGTLRCISWRPAAPLAKALIGKAKGATIEVNAPGGAKGYEIKKVEWR